MNPSNLTRSPLILNSNGSTKVDVTVFYTEVRVDRGTITMVEVGIDR